MTHNCKWALLLLAVIGSLGGCAASRLPDYPTMAVDNYGDHKSNAGLTVAIHPMTDLAETKKYFGADLLKSNVLAVLVVADNRNPTTSYFIQKDQIQLVNAGPEGQGRSKVGDTTAANNVAAFATFVVGGLVLQMVAFNMYSDALEVRRNFSVKELQQETVSPGEAKRGFAYFQLPNGSTRPLDVIMRIGFLDPVAGTTVSFDYNIHIGGN